VSGQRSRRPFFLCVDCAPWPGSPRGSRPGAPVRASGSAVRCEPLTRINIKPSADTPYASVLGQNSSSSLRAYAALPEKSRIFGSPYPGEHVS